MRKRLLFYSGLAVLAILVAIIVWQGSFSFGPLAPTSVEQTYLFWAVSTLIFILTVTLGFMLFRTAVKLYIERRSNLAGSHIRSKLVAGERPAGSSASTAARCARSAAISPSIASRLASPSR